MDEELSFLDEPAQKLVRQMLSAVVEHPEVHRNMIKRQRTRDDQFEYFVAQRGGSAAIVQNQKLPNSIVEPLVARGWMEANPEPGFGDGWLAFTDGAKAWYRRSSTPTDIEIQRRIGQMLFEQYPKGMKPSALSAQIGVPNDRLARNLRILGDLRLVRIQGSVWVDRMPPPDPDRPYYLTKDRGVGWGNTGFPMAGSDQQVSVNLSVELKTEVWIALQEARAAEIPRELLDQFEARLRRVEEELEDPEGRFEPVKEMMETANQSKELLGPAVKFMYRNWDKIQKLGETAADAVSSVL